MSASDSAWQTLPASAPAQTSRRNIAALSGGSWHTPTRTWLRRLRAAAERWVCPEKLPAEVER